MAFNDAAATDARIDAWHEGYFSRRDGKANPWPPTHSLASEWEQGRAQQAKDARVRVVMPARPEGYYHCAVGSFE